MSVEEVDVFYPDNVLSYPGTAGRKRCTTLQGLARQHAAISHGDSEGGGFCCQCSCWHDWQEAGREAGSVTVLVSMGAVSTGQVLYKWRCKLWAVFLCSSSGQLLLLRFCVFWRVWNIMSTRTTHACRGTVFCDRAERYFHFFFNEVVKSNNTMTGKTNDYV